MIANTPNEDAAPDQWRAKPVALKWAKMQELLTKRTLLV
jgi:hypothetical protein